MAPGVGVHTHPLFHPPTHQSRTRVAMSVVPACGRPRANDPRPTRRAIRDRRDHEPSITQSVQAQSLARGGHFWGKQTASHVSRDDGAEWLTDEPLPRAVYAMTGDVRVLLPHTRVVRQSVTRRMAS